MSRSPAARSRPRSLKALSTQGASRATASCSASCTPWPRRPTRESAPRSARSGSRSRCRCAPGRGHETKRAWLARQTLGGGVWLLLVVAAVPEGDVTLRDAIEDSVGLRLRDDLVVDE